MTSDLPDDPLSELDDEPAVPPTRAGVRRSSRRSLLSESTADSEEDADEDSLSGDDLLDLDAADSEVKAVSAKAKRASGKGGAATPAARKKAKKAAAQEDLDEIGPSTERLQKVLASAGLASRRHCEEYILDGRVTVDGKTVRVLGIKVDPETQQVCVDGERVKIERKRHFIVTSRLAFTAQTPTPWVACV